MAYKVMIDNNTIYDPKNSNEKDLMITKPKLTVELNENSSLEFTMPSIHKYIDNYSIRKSAVKVYEDDTLIFVGRITETEDDFYKNRKFYCEGPFAFFTDTIQSEKEYDPTTVSAFLNDVISRHNQQAQRGQGISALPFRVGKVTVNPNKSIYRKLGYETTKNVLTRMLLDAEGGYFFITYQGSYFQIDYINEMPYTSNQTIQFGSNLLDFTKNFDASDIVTAVCPLGNNNLTCAQANGGSIYVSDQNLVNQYGWVCVTKQWNDVGPGKLTDYTGRDDDAEAKAEYQQKVQEHAQQEAQGAVDLKSKGLDYLRSRQYDRMLFEISAAELHSQFPNLQALKVGQSVRVLSLPHGLDRYFPLTKMDINLDSNEKKITLGTEKHKDLTEITKQEDKAIEQSRPTSSTTINNYSTKGITAAEVDDKIANALKNQKKLGMPVNLFYSVLPKTNYNIGDHIDYSKARVSLSYADGHVEDVTSRVSWVPSNQFTVAPGFEASAGIVAVYRFNASTGAYVHAPVTAWPDGKLVAGTGGTRDLVAAAPVDINMVEVVAQLPANPDPKVIYYVTSKAKGKDDGTGQTIPGSSAGTGTGTGTGTGSGTTTKS